VDIGGTLLVNGVDLVAENAALKARIAALEAKALPTPVVDVRSNSMAYGVSTTSPNCLAGRKRV
jgi:hypothetical protein